MTFPDLFKELNDTAKERIKNPIIGAFICSFLVCNWQPIFILSFSDMSIEERIEFMNTKWKILLPICISIGYTVLIPLIMIGLDYILMPMKRKRIANIYQNKGFTTDKKIVHAEKEFQLKSAESGNKDRQALLDQIKSLEESKNQIEGTNNKIVSNLTEKLEEANNTFSETVESKNQKISDLLVSLNESQSNFTSIKIILEVIVQLDKFDIRIIKQMGESYYNLNYVTHIPEDRLPILTELGLVEMKHNNYTLTSLGQQLYSVIKEMTIE
ncbi:hypothetical protein SAMN06265349_101712 [Flavobacterium resistens]|nr:hypothetical protein SAMN06265349_101712 [Flavobacterium resistens]